MKITMHGAGQEVGRSCIEIQHQGKRFLFDAGIKIQHDHNEFPTAIKDIHKIDALFLSHAHMDHSGAIPLLHHQGLRCPIICTPLTKDITRILLKDSWKIDRIEGREKTYQKDVIYDVLDSMVLKRKGTVAGIRYEMSQTGHIPSSQAIHLYFDDHVFLYTGDVNGTDTQLLNGVTKYKQADTMMIESTYGNRGHPPRSQTEKEFIAAVKEILKQGGTVLLPSFAVGRAQELMILLHKAKLNVPIYLDGMSKKMLALFLKHNHELKNDDLQKATKSASSVDSWKMRKKVTQKQAVIIATAGMMDAGPVLGYLKHLYHNKKNGVFLTGYQADETNGRMLLETGSINLDGNIVKVEAQVEHFDFSAHAGREDLHKIIKSVNPTDLVLNHGDAIPEEQLAQWAQKKGITVHMPKTGQTITL